VTGTRGACATVTNRDLLGGRAGNPGRDVHGRISWEGLERRGWAGKFRFFVENLERGEHAGGE